MLTRLRKKGIQIENMHRTGSGYGGWRLKNRKLTRVVSMNWPEFQRQVCVINDEEVSLTPQETELLLILLLKHPKRHTPVSELIEAMWPNPDLEPDWAAKRLQVLVFNLRGKGVEIESRYQFGYRIPVHARGDTPQQLELAA
jgi:DNA-binding response OmpR family regulator